MATKKTAATSTDKEGNPWADSTGRYSVDQLLRHFGFVIAGRPKDAPPTWKRNGKVYTQKQAEKTISKHLIQDAKYAEDLYYSGEELFRGE